MVTGDRDQDRRALLRRSLTAAEREMLATHASALDKFVVRGSRSKKGDAIIAMMMGMGGATMTKEQAKEVTAQYISVCDDLPEWAVLRACVRFSQGAVKPEEVGSERLDPAFRPTTAQLYRVANALSEPVMMLRYRISEALRGVAALPRPTLTDEEKAANAEKIRLTLERFRGTRTLNADEEAEEHRKRREFLARAAVDHEQRILAQYREAGIDPPKPREGYPLVSLSLMLQRGWTIHEIAGRKVLVEPHVAKAPSGREVHAEG